MVSRLGVIPLLHLDECGHPSLYTDSAADSAAINEVFTCAANRHIPVALGEDYDNLVASLRVSFGKHFKPVFLLPFNRPSPKGGILSTGIEHLGHIIVDFLLVGIESGESARGAGLVVRISVSALVSDFIAVIRAGRARISGHRRMACH